MGLRVDMGADEYTSAPTAVLNVYPKQLAFYADVGGRNPESQILHVENAGFAPLAWDIAEDCPWLAISGPPDGVQGVCLDVDVVGLGPGRHDCEVTVTADHVPNSPQLVHASLYIRAGRYLHVPWPYDTIQSAIEAARDTVIVQPGTYTGQGNRDIDFLGKAITVRSTDPNDPGVVAATIIHCGGTTTEPHRGFVFQSGEDANSVLAGLTVTGAVASRGAGLYVDNGSPTILRCNIVGNLCAPSGSGGGIYIRLGNPHVEQCFIMDNQCDGGGSRGGGIYCRSSSVIVNCDIRSNRARSDGGGIFLGYGDSVFSGCVVVDNEARFGGGAGICVWYAKGVLSHCVVAENRSRDIGGAILLKGSELTIRNSTIAGNTAGDRGGAVFFSTGKLSLANAILWGNKAPRGPEIAIYTWDGIADNRGDSYRLTGVVDVLGGGCAELQYRGRSTKRVHQRRSALSRVELGPRQYRCGPIVCPSRLFGTERPAGWGAAPRGRADDGCGGGLSPQVAGGAVEPG